MLFFIIKKTTFFDSIFICVIKFEHPLINWSYQWGLFTKLSDLPTKVFKKFISQYSQYQPRYLNLEFHSNFEYFRDEIFCQLKCQGLNVSLHHPTWLSTTLSIQNLTRTILLWSELTWPTPASTTTTSSPIGTRDQSTSLVSTTTSTPTPSVITYITFIT